MRKLSCLLFLAIFAAFYCAEAAAQTPAIRLQPFLSGLSEPVFITNAGDNSNRLFVVQKGGIIKVVQPGTLATTDFLNISSRISIDGERGLLGLAFHPQYAANRRFFVYYTRASDGDLQIAEYQASTANQNVADTAEKVIITIEHSANNNHNGGTIAFGADGYLYAGTGDGGGGNDPPNNAQNIDSLLGKFIRLDINVAVGAPVAYAIPADNPFVGAAGADEIYAVGMRNPYRWSFDRGGTRQLWAADVGQGAFEEVDIITNGGNYGWRVYEGTQCTGLGPAACTPANYVAPVFQYSNANSPRCSITGGYVYRGATGVLPNGSYIYGDYCTGEILLWSGGQQLALLDTTRNIASFGEDETGEFYVVGLGGTVEKVAAVPTAAAVTVGGRVTTRTGRGIVNAVVTMTDGDGSVRRARSTSFGYYRFTDVAPGATYIFSARSKRHNFGTNARALSINEDTDNIDFVAGAF